MLTISLAGLTVGIHHSHAHLARQCAAYITEGTPDFEVTITPELLAAEKEHASTPATDGYFESIAAYREIAHRLPAYDAFLFHAAVIETGGEAFAFTAASGTGKSTHIRLWRKVYGDLVNIVNGDKPILRFLPDGRLIAYGTPWAGKEGWQRNVGVPLRAVVFLERGETDRIDTLPGEDAALRIMRQVLLTADPETVDTELALIDRMLASVDCKLLTCTPTENAARVAYAALTGQAESSEQKERTGK